MTAGCSRRQLATSCRWVPKETASRTQPEAPGTATPQKPSHRSAPTHVLPRLVCSVYPLLAAHIGPIRRRQTRILGRGGDMSLDPVNTDLVRIALDRVEGFPFERFVNDFYPAI